MRTYWLSTVLASCLAPASLLASDLQPGQWLISGDGETFVVEANQASLTDFLADLQQMTPGEIVLKPLTNRLISVRYTNIELARLLARLGLDYSLEYRRDATGDSLEGGWISVHDPARASAAPTFSFTPPAGAAGAAAGSAGATNAIGRKLLPAQPGETSTADMRAPGALPPLRLDGQLADWPADSGWHAVGSMDDTGCVDLAYAYTGVSDGTNLTVAVEIRDDMKAVTNGLAQLQTHQQDDDFINLNVPGMSEFTINRHHVLVKGPNGLQPASLQTVSQSDKSRAAIRDTPQGWLLEITMPTKTNQYTLTVSDRDASETPCP